MAATAARRVVREIPRASLFVYSTDAVQKMIVAAYARVSTEKEEQEDSFERQVEHYAQDSAFGFRADIRTAASGGGKPVPV